jgi:hypothetical protein
MSIDAVPAYHVVFAASWLLIAGVALLALFCARL